MKDGHRERMQPLGMKIQQGTKMHYFAPDLRAFIRLNQRHQYKGLNHA